MLDVSYWLLVAQLVLFVPLIITQIVLHSQVSVVSVCVERGLGLCAESVEFTFAMDIALLHGIQVGSLLECHAVLCCICVYRGLLAYCAHTIVTTL